MSTLNICFHEEFRKISVLLGWKNKTKKNSIKSFNTHKKTKQRKSMVSVISIHFHQISDFVHVHIWGGRAVWRCHVSYVTGASDWYWLTVGKACYPCSRLSVEGEWFLFFSDLGFTALSRIFHISSRSFIKGGRKTGEAGEKPPDHP